MSTEINYTELNQHLLGRKSIRTYHATQYPTEEQAKEIEEFIEKLNQIEKPFNRKVKLCLQKEDFGFWRTFAVIKGCKFWIYGVIPKNDIQSFRQFGYLFELLILKCTQMKLGTVWLGGTFTVGGFTKIQYDPNKEYIPCCSPVGIPRTEYSFESRMNELKSRKNWNEIFFIKNFEHSLQKENEKERKEICEIFKEEILESMRFSPSALNWQEWRIVFDGKNIHFFSTGGMFGDLDTGICIANGQVALEANGIKGKLEILNEKEICEQTKVGKGILYLVSFIGE